MFINFRKPWNQPVKMRKTDYAIEKSGKTMAARMYPACFRTSCWRMASISMRFSSATFRIVTWRQGQRTALNLWPKRRSEWYCLPSKSPNRCRLPRLCECAQESQGGVVANCSSNGLIFFHPDVGFYVFLSYLSLVCQGLWDSNRLYPSEFTRFQIKAKYLRADLLFCWFPAFRWLKLR